MSHTVTTMAPKFLKSKHYAAATQNIAALYPQLSKAQQTGLAAYIWYQRQMTRSDRYRAPGFECQWGDWVPVDPDVLNHIKQSTIDRWSAFYA